MRLYTTEEILEMWVDSPSDDPPEAISSGITTEEILSAWVDSPSDNSPEAISGSVYAGPGVASMIAAVKAWKCVADEMVSEVLKGLFAVFDVLETHWIGSSNEQVFKATKPFADWLVNVITEFEVTRRAALRLCEAYCAARQAVVPPEEIDNNRGTRAYLVGTNEFGLNAATIAELDDEYEVWKARDIKALATYDEAVSTALRELTPWAPPPRMTPETGSAQQAAEFNDRGSQPESVDNRDCSKSDEFDDDRASIPDEEMLADWAKYYYEFRAKAVADGLLAEDPRYSQP